MRWQRDIASPAVAATVLVLVVLALVAAHTGGVAFAATAGDDVAATGWVTVWKGTTLEDAHRIPLFSAMDMTRADNERTHLPILLAAGLEYRVTSSSAPTPLEVEGHCAHSVLPLAFTADAFDADNTTTLFFNFGGIFRLKNGELRSRWLHVSGIDAGCEDANEGATQQVVTLFDAATIGVRPRINLRADFGSASECSSPNEEAEPPLRAGAAVAVVPLSFVYANNVRCEGVVVTGGTWSEPSDLAASSPRRCAAPIELRSSERVQLDVAGRFFLCVRYPSVPRFVAVNVLSVCGAVAPLQSRAQLGVPLMPFETTIGCECCEARGREDRRLQVAGIDLLSVEHDSGATVFRGSACSADPLSAIPARIHRRTDRCLDAESCCVTLTPQWMAVGKHYLCVRFAHAATGEHAFSQLVRYLVSLHVPVSLAIHHSVDGEPQSDEDGGVPGQKSFDLPLPTASGTSPAAVPLICAVFDPPVAPLAQSTSEAAAAASAAVSLSSGGSLAERCQATFLGLKLFNVAPIPKETIVVPFSTAADGAGAGCIAASELLHGVHAPGRFDVFFVSPEESSAASDPGNEYPTFAPRRNRLRVRGPTWWRVLGAATPNCTVAAVAAAPPDGQLLGRVEGAAGLRCVVMVALRGVALDPLLDAVVSSNSINSSSIRGGRNGTGGGGGDETGEGQFHLIRRGRTTGDFHATIVLLPTTPATTITLTYTANYRDTPGARALWPLGSLAVVQRQQWTVAHSSSPAASSAAHSTLSVAEVCVEEGRRSGSAAPEDVLLLLTHADAPTTLVIEALLPHDERDDRTRLRCTAVRFAFGGTYHARIVGGGSDGAGAPIGAVHVTGVGPAIGEDANAIWEPAQARQPPPPAAAAAGNGEDEGKHTGNRTRYGGVADNWLRPQVDLHSSSNVLTVYALQTTTSASGVVATADTARVPVQACTVFHHRNDSNVPLDGPQHVRVCSRESSSGGEGGSGVAGGGAVCTRDNIGVTFKTLVASHREMSATRVCVAFNASTSASLVSSAPPGSREEVRLRVLLDPSFLLMSVVVARVSVHLHEAGTPDDAVSGARSPRVLASALLHVTLTAAAAAPPPSLAASSRGSDPSLSLRALRRNARLFWGRTSATTPATTAPCTRWWGRGSHGNGDPLVSGIAVGFELAAHNRSIAEAVITVPHPHLELRRTPGSPEVALREPVLCLYDRASGQVGVVAALRPAGLAVPSRDSENAGDEGLRDDVRGQQRRERQTPLTVLEDSATLALAVVGFTKEELLGHRIYFAPLPKSADGREVSDTSAAAAAAAAAPAAAARTCRAAPRRARKRLSTIMHGAAIAEQQLLVRNAEGGDGNDHARVALVLRLPQDSIAFADTGETGHLAQAAQHAAKRWVLCHDIPRESHRTGGLGHQRAGAALRSHVVPWLFQSRATFVVSTSASAGVPQRRALLVGARDSLEFFWRYTLIARLTGSAFVSMPPVRPHELLALHEHRSASSDSVPDAGQGTPLFDVSRSEGATSTTQDLGLTSVPINLERAGVLLLHAHHHDGRVSQVLLHIHGPESARVDLALHQVLLRLPLPYADELGDGLVAGVRVVAEGLSCRAAGTALVRRRSPTLATSSGAAIRVVTFQLRSDNNRTTIPSGGRAANHDGHLHLRRHHLCIRYNASALFTATTTHHDADLIISGQLRDVAFAAPPLELASLTIDNLGPDVLVWVANAPELARAHALYSRLNGTLASATPASLTALHASAHLTAVAVAPNQSPEEACDDLDSDFGAPAATVTHLARAAMRDLQSALHVLGLSSVPSVRTARSAPPTAWLVQPRATGPHALCIAFARAGAPPSAPVSVGTISIEGPASLAIGARATALPGPLAGVARAATDQLHVARTRPCAPFSISFEMVPGTSAALLLDGLFFAAVSRGAAAATCDGPPATAASIARPPLWEQRRDASTGRLLQVVTLNATLRFSGTYVLCFRRHAKAYTPQDAAHVRQLLSVLRKNGGTPTRDAAGRSGGRGAPPAPAFPLWGIPPTAAAATTETATAKGVEVLGGGGDGGGIALVDVSQPALTVTTREVSQLAELAVQLPSGASDGAEDPRARLVLTFFEVKVMTASPCAFRSWSLQTADGVALGPALRVLRSEQGRAFTVLVPRREDLARHFGFGEGCEEDHGDGTESPVGAAAAGARSAVRLVVDVGDPALDYAAPLAVWELPAPPPPAAPAEAGAAGAAAASSNSGEGEPPGVADADSGVGMTALRPALQTGAGAGGGGGLHDGGHDFADRWDDGDDGDDGDEARSGDRNHDEEHRNDGGAAPGTRQEVLLTPTQALALLLLGCAGLGVLLRFLATSSFSSSSGNDGQARTSGARWMWLLRLKRGWAPSALARPTPPLVLPQISLSAISFTSTFSKEGGGGGGDSSRSRRSAAAAPIDDEGTDVCMAYCPSANSGSFTTTACEDVLLGSVRAMSVVVTQEGGRHQFVPVGAARREPVIVLRFSGKSGATRLDQLLRSSSVLSSAAKREAVAEAPTMPPGVLRRDGLPIDADLRGLAEKLVILPFATAGTAPGASAPLLPLAGRVHRQRRVSPSARYLLFPARCRVSVGGLFQRFLDDTGEHRADHHDPPPSPPSPLLLLLRPSGIAAACAVLCWCECVARRAKITHAAAHPHQHVGLGEHRATFQLSLESLWIDHVADVPRASLFVAPTTTEEATRSPWCADFAPRLGVLIMWVVRSWVFVDDVREEYLKQQQLRQAAAGGSARGPRTPPTTRAAAVMVPPASAGVGTELSQGKSTERRGNCEERAAAPTASAAVLFEFCVAHRARFPLTHLLSQEEDVADEDARTRRELLRIAEDCMKDEDAFDDARERARLEPRALASRLLSLIQHR